jgi:hypothetical protein
MTDNYMAQAYLPQPVAVRLVGDEFRKTNCGRSIQGGKLS